MSREMGAEAIVSKNRNSLEKPVIFKELEPSPRAVEISNKVKNIVCDVDVVDSRKLINDFFDNQAAINFGPYSFKNFEDLKKLFGSEKDAFGIPAGISRADEANYKAAHQVYLDLIDGAAIGSMWGNNIISTDGFNDSIVSRDIRTVEGILGLDTKLNGIGEAVVNAVVTNEDLIAVLNNAQWEIMSNGADLDPGHYSRLVGEVKKVVMNKIKHERSDRGSKDLSEAEMLIAYFSSLQGGANAIREKQSRGSIEIPKTKDEQLKLMRSAVEVFETLYKAPSEGLEIMDQTVVFNSFLLDSLKGTESVVDGRVLQEMKARVKNLVVAKAMMSAGGFMPSDRQGLDVVSVIERLRGTGDLLNSNDLDYFFRGDGNGLPIKEVWNLRQEWDFGTSYEDSIRGVVNDYDRYKDEPVVVEMFARYGFNNNAENFAKMMFDGIYDGDNLDDSSHVNGWLRPTKDVPFFADRGQTFSEDSNALRKNVIKRSVNMQVRDSGIEGAEANFNEAWGIVDLLRYSTAEDIRARINLEGHYTIWEGMSGILNNLDRSGKLKTSADLYWAGQQIIQMGAPYMCYTMRHDIFTPIYASEINPLAFLDPKTDLSYWSAWVKTTQKASDYLNGGLDQKSLGSSVIAMQDVIAKSLKAPTVVNMGGGEGYVDNYARDPGRPSDFVLDEHGRRKLDKKKSLKIERKLKTLFVRQAIQGLINISDIADGDEIESLVKTSIQFRKELTTPHYSDINYVQAPPIVSSQPNFTEITNKATQMEGGHGREKTMETLAFMTPNEFDQVLKDLGFEQVKWRERGKDALEAVLTGLSGMGSGGKKK